MKPPAQPRAYRRRAYDAPPPRDAFDQNGVRLATRRELTRDTLALLAPWPGWFVLTAIAVCAVLAGIGWVLAVTRGGA